MPLTDTQSEVDVLAPERRSVRIGCVYKFTHKSVLGLGLGDQA
jgi:hypothetical protein